MGLIMVNCSHPIILRIFSQGDVAMLLVREALLVFSRRSALIRRGLVSPGRITASATSRHYITPGAGKGRAHHSAIGTITCLSI